jgi:hypothetical protein
VSWAGPRPRRLSGAGSPAGKSAQPAIAFTDVQTAVIVTVAVVVPKAKPVAVQPFRVALGPLSLTNAFSSSLTIAPPPITKVPTGQVAVAVVPVFDVLGMATATVGAA